MPSKYNGQPSNTGGNLPPQLSIFASTAANPIVVTTTVNHGLSTGDWVDITDHQTNSLANGIWPVTVTGNATFSIPVAGFGVGGATGHVQSLAVGPTFQLPSDGDAFAASSFNAAFMALGDRTAFLGQATGAYKIAAIQYATHDTGTTTPPTSWAGFSIGTADTWTASGVIFPFDGMVVGDVAVVNLTTTSENGGAGAGGANVAFKLGYAQTAPPLGSPTYLLAPGASQWLFVTGGLVLYTPCTLKAIIPIVTTGILAIQPFMLSNTTGVFANLIADYILEVVTYRPTNIYPSQKTYPQ